MPGVPALIVARTLSTNHPLKTPRQAPDLEAVDRDFTRPFRMPVSDARDRPNGGLPLVSAASRLVSTLFQHWIIGIWGR